MCGIAGYILKNETRPSTEFINVFLNDIRRRGPDDEGVSLIARSSNEYVNYQTLNTRPSLHQHMPLLQNAQQSHDVAFMHSRYAILDLSSKGHQPYVSLDGSIVGIFNGEIYNYIELRKELLSLGVNFVTKSDTEVLVEGYSKWGEELWAKMNGFWAVVLYDRRNRTIIFSRDRMGVAPLYYRETHQGLFFASYIQPLILIHGQTAKPNVDALLGFAQTGFKDIEDSTCYEEIKSLPAATLFYLGQGQHSLAMAKQKKYWSLPAQRLNENEISFTDVLKQFRTIFFDAVDIRLRSDVKIAFELSGGLDSSSVVAAGAMLNKNKITTYTAKIHGANEEPFARAMLQKYDLDYRVLADMENNFKNDCSGFSRFMEEPYDNPNAYTHFQMLKVMKSQGVQVVMTGAGGDETFAGYEASFWPKAYREWKSQGIGSYLKADWYEACRRYKTVHKSVSTLKHYYTGTWQRLFARRSLTKQLSSEISSTALKHYNEYGSLSFDEQRRFHFTCALLPFYMRSSDHFTMGIPIEHRFPLLDYRLVEFGLQLPISYLFRNGWTKYILRKAMEPYLPKAIVWRREKMGFQFPYRSYFQAHRTSFDLMLENCYQMLPQLRVLGDYQTLLVQNPVLLWRLLSIGIWQKGLMA